MSIHPTDPGVVPTPSLSEMMQEQLSAGAVMVGGGRDLHIEVIEVATGRVWMSVEPATQPDYEDLLTSLDDSLRPVGIGAAVMDAALFLFSPDGEEEPVRERTLNGSRYINVAIPGERSALPGGMMKMMVNKAHVIGYEAGRTVKILSLPEGDFVDVVGIPDRDNDLPLPEGASLRTIELMQPWVVPLPTPTTTLWHFSDDGNGSSAMRSFQGPVTLPAD